MNRLQALQLDGCRIQKVLADLVESCTGPCVEGRFWEEDLARLRPLTDARSEAERAVPQSVGSARGRFSDDAQKEVAEVSGVVDFFHELGMWVFCGGCVHEEPAWAARDREDRNELVRSGSRAVVLRYSRDLAGQLERHPEVFGKGRVF